MQFLFWPSVLFCRSVNIAPAISPLLVKFRQALLLPWSALFRNSAEQTTAKGPLFLTLTPMRTALPDALTYYVIAVQTEFEKLKQFYRILKQFYRILKQFYRILKQFFSIFKQFYRILKQF